MAVKAQKPSLEDVHQKVRASLSAQVFGGSGRIDKERAAYAVDAIKLYGIDDFFCEYGKWLVHVSQPTNMPSAAPNWEAFYIHAAELYHGSKQHWRRRT